ncbi:MAG TPA: hypothetical protein VEW69_01035, partial [Alphaproteobacteria bacterium]|nr:hypothetical protein [Alphaproteobacteria bacterium]
MKKTTNFALIFAFCCFHLAFGQSRTNAEEKYRQAMAVLLTSGSSQSDRDGALIQLQSAAEQNYVPAQTALGTYYSHSDFAPRDMTKAVDWF